MPLLIPATETLKGTEPLLSNERLERIWERLIRKYRPDRQVDIVTYVQPASDRIPEEYAVFRIISKHPKPAFVGQELQQIASLPLRQWRDAEDTRKHYVGAGDPAEAILDGLFRQHVDNINNLKELI